MTDLDLDAIEARNRVFMLPHATEDALIAEVRRLRTIDPMFADAYMQVQAVLDDALGTGVEDGAGGGIAADVHLLAQQRDAARAAIARVRALCGLAELDVMDIRYERLTPPAVRTALEGAS